MPEHPGFDLKAIKDRTIVRLRVRPHAAIDVAAALQLPTQALQWIVGDPMSLWVAPDQWLIVSDTKTAKEIMSELERNLSGQLYAATNVSSGNACFSLSGFASRTILAMGCGIDTHKRSFKPGQCVRTRFADVPLFIAALEDNSFELYVDRSFARYLCDWLTMSSEDPVTRDVKFDQMAVS